MSTERVRRARSSTGILAENLPRVIATNRKGRTQATRTNKMMVKVIFLPVAPAYPTLSRTTNCCLEIATWSKLGTAGCFGPVTHGSLGQDGSAGEGQKLGPLLLFLKLVPC